MRAEATLSQSIHVAMAHSPGGLTVPRFRSGTLNSFSKLS